MKVTFLGTGTSRGVPVIGCDCEVCASDDPRNDRLRTSALLEEGRSRAVVDTSADFRQQMLRHDVRRLDAAVFTHAHVDHILGLDDVFPFNVYSRKDFPIYASPRTMKEIKITFRHLFTEDRWPGVPSLEDHLIEGPFSVGKLRFEPIEVDHGSLPILGFRVGPVAWLTDVSHIPEASREKLKGLRALALDALRHKPHPTHFSLSEAAEEARALGAEKTYLIHMSHDVEHEEGNACLPEGVELAYDGLELEFE